MTLRLHSWPAPLQTLALVASPRLGLWNNGHEQLSEHGSSSNQHHIASSKKQSHGRTSSQFKSLNNNEEEEPC